MNIIDYIRLFSRFPGDIQEVINHFRNRNSSLPEALKLQYDLLKSELVNQPERELIPELKGFYFSNSPEELVTAIKNIPMPFLLVLYPDTNIQLENNFNRTESKECIFSILQEYDARNKDLFEKLIIDQLTETIADKIISFLTDPSKDCKLLPEITNIEKYYETSFGCVGWSVSMQLKM